MTNFAGASPTHPNRFKGQFPRGSPWVALFLLVPAQSLGVASMLLAFPGPVGVAINGASRAWMLGFPIAWTLLVERRRPVLVGPSRGGLLAGLASGLAILAVMLTTYALVADRIDLDALRDRARATGFDRPAAFAAIFAYIILVNSLLEEYVWRWFVFRQAEALLPASFGKTTRSVAAVVIAAALFTIHHVVALAAWVDGPLVVLGSTGVFLGALVWSALFARYRSLWPCYLSHILADVAILAMGDDLLFRPSG